jgi:predicted transcriptional regulator
MSSRKTLQTLLAVSRSPSPGPAPAFTPVHISRAVLLVGDEGPIGRIELSRKLGLGEGAVRTILKHLSGAGFIDPAKEGCVLTQRGVTLYKSLRSKLSRVYSVNARQLALDKASVAVLIRNSAAMVRRGIEQRDAAIRAGASGACTLVFRTGKLLMPMGERDEWTLSSNDPLAHDLQKLFAPKDGDVITIVSAPYAGLAEHCAMAAALTLLG